MKPKMIVVPPSEAVGKLAVLSGFRPAIHCPGRYTRTLRRVVIVRPPVAKLKGCGAESLINSSPLLDGGTINRNGAATAMIRCITTIDVIFQADEGGKHLRT